MYIHTCLFKHGFENNENERIPNPKLVAPSEHNDLGKSYRTKRQVAQADFFRATNNRLELLLCIVVLCCEHCVI